MKQETRYQSVELLRSGCNYEKMAIIHNILKEKNIGRLNFQLSCFIARVTFHFGFLLKVGGGHFTK